MIEVVQAFDRAPIARLESDDAAALDHKIETARRLFADRQAWLKPHQRIDILRKLAVLMESKREHLGRQIAREGGKPLTDAQVETDRAIDGVRNAADELRVMAGREIPMGMTPASIDRRAFGRINGTTLVPSIIVNPPADAKSRPSKSSAPSHVSIHSHLDEAIAAANSLPVAFQASIFTEDLRTAFDAAERLAASAVMVNDNTSFRTDWMPFAGRREFGYGIGGIPWTMREMSEQKMIVFRM